MSKDPMVRRLFCGVALTGVALLGACAELHIIPASAELDARFGQATRQARAVQTLNPDASRNLEPPMGIDAVAAQHAIGVYQDSFKAPPTTFNVLNIGGSSLGSSSP